MDRLLALALSILRGGDMAEQPMPAVDLSPAEIIRELTESLPEWRRHQRCPAGMRCRVEHGEWLDTLLEELSATTRAHA